MGERGCCDITTRSCGTAALGCAAAALPPYAHKLVRQGHRPPAEAWEVTADTRCGSARTG